MDPRESRFLASQHERLASAKKQHKEDDQASESVNNVHADMTNDVGGKDRGDQFFSDFRKICSEFRSQLDSLLLTPSNRTDIDAPSSVDTSIRDDATTYYATASRRNEGRARLDVILRNVRLLQSHALSTSSLSSPVSSISSNRDDEKSDSDEVLLQSILQIPMSDITQTDMRLMSQELDGILKRIDHAREIICPKEKFVFKRYRMAMEEIVRSDRNGHCPPPPSTGVAVTIAEDKSHADTEDDVKDRGVGSLPDYGGVLEGMSNCTIEVYSDGTVHVDRLGDGALRYYGAPRPAHALHPPCIIDDGGHGWPSSRPAISRDSSSYLLRDLNSVIVVVHGSRPSLHLQHVRECKVYVTEPTLGAVHVTDCHSSVIRCSCYQLRVHDSRDVKFDVWTRSGPIIEDCVGMEFSGNYYRSGRATRGGGGEHGECVSGDDGSDVEIVGRNMFWDVKDFNWLRASRRSPNFVVVATSTAFVDEAVCIEAPLASDTDIVPSEEFADPSTSITEEDDSEDEL
jgi:hypothetical protein